MHNEKGIQRGKDFEQIIREAFSKVDGTVVERMPDPTNGYLGIRNKSDFIIYHYPYQYYIECKTVHSHRLPFTNITFNQRVGMLDVSKTKGVIAGVICWFIPCDKTYFIPIQLIEKYRLDGIKSLNLNAQDTSEWIEISGEKKRVFYNYDIGSFIDYCTKNHIGEKAYE